MRSKTLLAGAVGLGFLAELGLLDPARTLASPVPLIR
jgi:hypothetical protein